MIEIRNLKFQPLALHLANSKRSVHLPARGKATVDDKAVSAEIRNAAQRSFVALRELKPTTPAPPVQPTTSAAPAPAGAKPVRKPDFAAAKDTKDKE